VDDIDGELLNSRVMSIDLGKEVSGLTNRVNITFYNESTSLQNATCVFLDGAGDDDDVSACCLTLVLIIHAIFRRNNSDHLLNIHVNLSAALMFLNLTFVINDSLASLNIHGVCVFIGAATHFFLLCTITWFAIEGFHLYLLIIRVFNTYFRKYLLKLALVGWGLPIVAVIAIISCSKYGKFSIYKLEGGTVTMYAGDLLHLNRASSHSGCYLTEEVLPILTFSFFVLAFLVNLLICIMVTVKVVRARHLGPALQEKGITKRDIFSLMGISLLLGVPWGVQLFQFEHLKEASFYIFCIFNSFHGFFLLLRYSTLPGHRWNKSPESATTTSTNTSTNTS
ncbi:hypothetical protein JZ751_020930, partial [Albula glossodonta]